MYHEEVEVPREACRSVLEAAEETWLGQANGAKRQYRHGNLHIREYGDRCLVHADRVDPRRDPLGHLLHDAPEILAGLGCAVLGGVTGGLVARKASRPKKVAAAAGIISAVSLGYAGHAVARHAKKGRGG